MKIQDIPFLVVDLETTGSSPHQNSIIEIGACKILNGKIVDTFHSLIKPSERIPFYISWMTGINNRMVSASPVFKDIAPDFHAFLKEGIFVAHNVSFDFEFLKAAFRQTSHKTLTNFPLCTIKLARRIFPGFTHYNLPALCRNLGIVHDRHHRALDDSLATAKLLLLILERLQKAGIESVIDLERVYHSTPDECREYFGKVFDLMPAYQRSS